MMFYAFVWFLLVVLLKQLGITWKKVVKSLGLWESVREFARMYDAGMGMLIFAPVAVLSWFPFISTFQSRLLYNQAFSRGLEISIILAGNKANVEALWFCIFGMTMTPCYISDLLGSDIVCVYRWL